MINSSVAVANQSQGFRAAQLIASRLIEEWRGRSDPSTRAALTRYPQLKQYRSLTLDLAYEEYCLRQESGEAIDADNFCRQFPDLLDSLERRIAIHLVLAAEPALPPIASPTDWPEVGDTVLGYHILGEIGRGSFARVYRARETSLGNRLVAIKVCVHGSDEADTLGRVQHPSIVPVHSVTQDGSGLTVICMPLLGTDTLGTLIERRGQQDDELANLRAAIHWILPIARALEHAHQMGVVHLDLKPANILITDDQQPMLLDFNLANDEFHHTHRAGGTLPYMSPEQIAQLVTHPTADARLDARSDIFSLGVILYQLVYQQVPWDLPDEIHELVELAAEFRKRQQQLPRLAACSGAELQAIIERCLAADRIDRFQSMRELVEALEQTMRFRSRLADSVHRNRRLLLALAATLAVSGFSFGIQLASRPNWADELVEHAQAAINHGQHADAVGLLSEAMQDDVARPWARLLRGLALARQQDFRSALEDLQLSWHYYNAPVIALLIGDCHRQLQQPREALDWYHRGQQDDKPRWPALVNMAHVAMQLDDHDQAATLLDLAATAEASGPAYFYARLLNCHWSTSDHQRSHKQLATWAKQLASHYFTGPQAHTDLARAFAHLANEPGNCRMAKLHIQQAIYQGAELQRLAHDPELAHIFQQSPELYQQRVAVDRSRQEPIPELAALIAIDREVIERRRSGNYLQPRTVPP